MVLLPAGQGGYCDWRSLKKVQDQVGVVLPGRAGRIRVAIADCPENPGVLLPDHTRIGGVLIEGAEAFLYTVMRQVVEGFHDGLYKVDSDIQSGCGR